MSSVNHDVAAATVLRLRDLEAQIKEMREEQTTLRLNLKDWLYRQNLEKATISGHYVRIVKNTSTTVSLTSIREKYSSEQAEEIIENCGRQSVTYAVKITENKS